MSVMGDAVLFPVFKKTIKAKDKKPDHKRAENKKTKKGINVNLLCNLRTAAFCSLLIKHPDDKEKDKNLDYLDDDSANYKKEKSKRPLWFDTLISSRHSSCGFK